MPKMHHLDQAVSTTRLTRLLLWLGFAYLSLVGLAMVSVAQFLPIYAERYEPLYQAILCHGIAAIPFAIAVVRFPRNTGNRIMAPKILLLALTLIVILSADRILTVIISDIRDYGKTYVLHDERGWANAPNSESRVVTKVRFDQYGLRVSETGPIRDIHQGKRLLFIGDSLTFGYGHLAPVSFCEQTVSILNQRHPNLRLITLNAGVTGYCTGQEYHLLTHEGFDLDPDLVILEICLNDINHQFDRRLGADINRHAEFGQVIHSHQWSGIVRLMLKVGHLLREVARNYASQGKDEVTENFALTELFASRHSRRVTLAWDRMLDQLGSIIRACREKKVPLAIACFPLRRQMADPDFSTYPQTRVSELAKLQDIPFLDVLSVLEADMPRSQAAADRLFVDESHPTAIGHRLVGAGLADFLESCGLIDDLARQETQSDGH